MSSAVPLIVIAPTGPSAISAPICSNASGLHCWT